MKISIVIPAFNEERLLGETLRRVNTAAEALVRRGWEIEVVVCDNNSTDRTAEIARAGGARVVFEPFNQIARARNTGAREAHGDWLLFIDADSWPSAELFADVAEAIDSGRYLAGGSTVALEPGPYWRGRLVVRLWNGLSRARRLLAGSFIFCETAEFRRLGGFSEQHFAAEELELTARLKQRARATGRRIVILTRHPLVTSARKMYLYSSWEYSRFLLKTVLSGGRALSNRDACQPWYDGRR